MSSASHRGPAIEVSQAELDTVTAILRAHVPEREVWAFGSRARRCARPYSDLDLAIMGEAPLSLDTLAVMNEAFAESDRPWKVDVVEWARMGEAFRRIVERDRVVLQELAETRQTVA